MENAHTNVESVASPVVNECRFLDLDLTVYAPFILDGFNHESKCWIDHVQVFIHQLFNNCGFAGIVQTTEIASAKLDKYQCQSTNSMSILISLSFNRALRNIESIVIMIMALMDLKFCSRQFGGL